MSQVIQMITPVFTGTLTAKLLNPSGGSEVATASSVSRVGTWYESTYTGVAVGMYACVIYVDAVAYAVIDVYIDAADGVWGDFSNSVIGPMPTQFSDSGEVFTYADLVYRLKERRGLVGSDREMMQLQIAVADAYRELPTYCLWRHYHRRVVITTEAKQDFTASYVASTRLLTLASGTWPANAVLGEILYGNARYKVKTRMSNTVLELSSVDQEVSNFTSQTVSWSRSSYVLPYVPKRIESVIVESIANELTYVDPTQMVREKRRFTNDSGNSIYYTIRPSDYYAGVNEIEISPVPSSASRIEVTMHIRPTPFKTFELTGTDAATSEDSTVFSSASAAFTSQIANCLLRISASSTIPKGTTQFDTTRAAYATQAVVSYVSYSNANTLFASAAFTSTVTGKGYTVSDIADIDINAMLAVLEALAWKKFCYNVAAFEKLGPAANLVFAEEINKAKAASATVSAEMESPTQSEWYNRAFSQPNVYPMGS
jgi:hypothetical protein